VHDPQPEKAQQLGTCFHVIPSHHCSSKQFVRCLTWLSISTYILLQPHSILAVKEMINKGSMIPFASMTFKFTAELTCDSCLCFSASTSELNAHVSSSTASEHLRKFFLWSFVPLAELRVWLIQFQCHFFCNLLQSLAPLCSCLILWVSGNARQESGSRGKVLLGKWDNFQPPENIASIVLENVKAQLNECCEEERQK